MSKKKLALPITVALANQAISSGANLLFTLYLVSVLSVAEFGIYGIGSSIILFYSGIGGALFVTQMVVHLPEKKSCDRSSYAARMLGALTIFSFVAGLFFLLTLSIAIVFDWVPKKYAVLLLAIGCASISTLLKDFFLRYSYSLRSEVSAVYINLAFAFGLIVAILSHGWLYKSDYAAFSAFIFITCGNLLGIAVGVIVCSINPSFTDGKKITSDFRDAWAEGYWAVLGGLIVWTQSQAYVYIMAFFAGPAAVGMANAARLFITPATFFGIAATQILTPRMASLRVENPVRLLQMNQKLTFVIGALAGVYAILCLGSYEYIAQHLLAEKYQNIFLLVAGWCLVLIFQFMRIGSSVTLQVQKKFKVIAINNLVSAIVAMLLSGFMFEYYGLSAGIIGMAIGEFILAVLLYRAVFREKID